MDGMNCAQAVAGAFADWIGLPLERVFALTGGFGGGFRTGAICGAVSGAAVVLGAQYPHVSSVDRAAKAHIGEKMLEFERRFQQRTMALDCSALRDLAPDPSISPAAERLGIKKSCDIYIASAVEILEEMLHEEAR